MEYSDVPAYSQVFLLLLPVEVATFSRLSPPRQPHLRRLSPLRVEPATSGAVNSGDLTGGVYKTRERIHGTVSDVPLLAIPAS